MDLTPTNPEKSISERLDALLPQLTRNQLRFLVAMQECATKTEAAAAIGLKADTVLHWPKVVDDALALVAQDVAATARAMNRRALLKAMAVKVAGLDSDDPMIRQRTATELIEWQLGKATQPNEHSGTVVGVQVTAGDLTEAAAFVRAWEAQRFADPA